VAPAFSLCSDDQELYHRSGIDDGPQLASRTPAVLARVQIFPLILASSIPIGAKSMTTQATLPKVGVGVLLTDNRGRILLTLRKRPPEANHWSIVGGKLDYFEPLEACAIREAKEEVGLEIVIDRLLCVTDHCLPEEGQHWVAPAYLGRILSGQATNCEPDKTQEVRWFPPDALPANLTMTARNAIAAFLAQRAML
jgi:8-oxo-dGTP diphosphatase